MTMTLEEYPLSEPSEERNKNGNFGLPIAAFHLRQLLVGCGSPRQSAVSTSILIGVPVVGSEAVNLMTSNAAWCPKQLLQLEQI